MGSDTRGEAIQPADAWVTGRALMLGQRGTGHGMEAYSKAYGLRTEV